MSNRPRFLLLIAILLGLVPLSACRRAGEQPPATPASEAAPAESGSTPPVLAEAADLLTTDTAPTTAPAPLRETAPFFSERFLRPDQRLERRQSRILSVLEPIVEAESTATLNVETPAATTAPQQASE